MTKLNNEISKQLKANSELFKNDLSIVKNIIETQNKELEAENKEFKNLKDGNENYTNYDLFIDKVSNDVLENVIDKINIYFKGNPYSYVHENNDGTLDIDEFMEYISILKNGNYLTLRNLLNHKNRLLVEFTKNELIPILFILSFFKKIHNLFIFNLDKVDKESNRSYSTLLMNSLKQSTLSGVYKMFKTKDQILEEINKEDGSIDKLEELSKKINLLPVNEETYIAYMKSLYEIHKGKIIKEESVDLLMFDIMNTIRSYEETQKSYYYVLSKLGQKDDNDKKYTAYKNKLSKKEIEDINIISNVVDKMFGVISKNTYDINEVSFAKKMFDLNHQKITIKKEYDYFKGIIDENVNYYKTGLKPHAEILLKQIEDLDKENKKFGKKQKRSESEKNDLLSRRAYEERTALIDSFKKQILLLNEYLEINSFVETKKISFNANFDYKDILRNVFSSYIPKSELIKNSIRKSDEKINSKNELLVRTLKTFFEDDLNNANNFAHSHYLYIMSKSNEATVFDDALLINYKVHASLFFGINLSENQTSNNKLKVS